MKKFIASLSLACALLTQSFALDLKPPSGNSIFTNQNSFILMTTVQDALELYIGNWMGSQSIYVDEKEVVASVIEQRYIPSRNLLEAKLIGSGKITSMGRSIPIRTQMYIISSKYLGLDIYTAENKIVKYRGFVDGNSVIWTHANKVMLPSIQTDSFFRGVKSITMSSTSIQYVNFPDYQGYMTIMAKMEKMDGSYKLDEVNSMKELHFSRPKNSRLGN